jgi:hypothetical protein
MIYKIKDLHGRTLSRAKNNSYAFYFRKGIEWKTLQAAERMLEVVKKWADCDSPKIVKI